MMVVGLFAVLAGCGSDDVEVGTIGAVEGFLGGVAADEPHAVAVGRDVLSAGGTAADAVVAMYFASAVTLPSSASLGGGGVCVAFNGEDRSAKTIEFLPRTGIHFDASADRPAAIPANIRGFFLLHARFGRLRWTQLLAPAESLARFGFSVSRAFASELQPLEQALRTDPEFARVFASRDGSGLVREGERLSQVELAAVISRICTESAGSFYAGPLAQRVVEAARIAGGGLDAAELRDYTPAVRETIKLSWGDEVAHFASPPAVGGVVAAQLWAILEDEGFGRASPQERSTMLVEVGSRVMAHRDRWLRGDGRVSGDGQSLVAPSRLAEIMRDAPTEVGVRPENPSATTFVAFDRDGSAAACAVTLNSPFGTGRVAPGTGIVLAAAPGTGGRGAEALGPMLIVNENVGAFYFAGAASGGIAAPSAMVGVAARTLLGEMSLTDAIAAKRVLGVADPSVAFFEEGFGTQISDPLTGRGYRPVPAKELGRVNAAVCTDGLPPNEDTCMVATDPRGHGLAAGSR